MKWDEIQSLFATQLEMYAPIKWQPLDPELSALRETLTALLLPIAYDGENRVHDLVGLIMSEDAYKMRHGANFPTPTCPAINNVDTPIDASNAVRVRREAAHTSKKEDYELFAASNRETSKFILSVVEDTWVPELQDPDLFYTSVKPRTLLNHLQAMCVGLHATDGLNPQNEMHTYHEEMEGIPKYINRLEDSHKQSNRAGNPITDPTLLLFAANVMLRTNRPPRANEIWEEFTSSDRNWARWKAIYPKADMAQKVKKTTQGKQDQFGAHGAFEKEGSKGGGLPQLLIKELDGYFHSLANAATTEKETLAELVKSNEIITTSSATLTATIAELQKQLEAIGRGTNPRIDPTRHKRTCPNCKKYVFHSVDDCYELKKMPTSSTQDGEVRCDGVGLLNC